jgi:uncharacterized membrane protein (DUF485 family)
MRGDEKRGSLDRMGEGPIEAEMLARVQGDTAFVSLVRRRARFRWLLTAMILVAYFGYIGLIAFDKSVLAQPIGAGVTSLGIPVGVALIVFTVALTGVYVWRANGAFDRLTREIVERATR